MPFGQGIDNTGPHPVKASGELVSVSAELTPGVKDGKDHGDSGKAGLVLNAHRDPAAIVSDPDNIPGEDLHLHMGAVPRHDLVNGIVYNFVNQMMKSLGTGRTDIHTGPFSNSLQAFQHLNFIFIILFCYSLTLQNDIPPFAMGTCLGAARPTGYFLEIFSM